MSPELIAGIAGLVATSAVATMAWSMRRNVKSVDDQIKSIATDVRQLAAQGSRHGESLAAGVQQFKTIEKRLDKVEERQERFQADCIACRVEKHG